MPVTTGITGCGADPRYLQKRAKKSPDASSGGEALPGWLHFDGGNAKGGNSQLWISGG